MAESPNYANSWPRLPVLELQETGVLFVEDGNHGQDRPRRSEFGTGDWAFIRAADMDAGTVRFDTADRINDEAVNRIRKGFGEPGDVLFSHKGTVGKLALAPLDAPLFVCSPQTTYWRALDTEKLDRRYLYYYMQSPEFMRQWQAVKGETDMADYVSLTAQRRFVVTLPPISVQRAIAGVLGTLDDKIEENRRLAGTLERLARAIFRAWFVDFEPVKAKAQGAKSFPSMPQPIFDSLPTRLVDADDGALPEGWHSERACDVATVAIGKTPPRKEPQWFTDDESHVPWVSIKDMGQSGAFIRRTSEYLTPEAVDRFRVRRIPDRSVLLSFKLTLGRVAIADGEITTNEAIAHFVPNATESVGSEYLYCYLLEFDHRRHGSTSSIATATNSRVIRAMPVLVPGENVAEAFTLLVRPIFDSLRAIGHESDKLAEVRDYLLPKLLSGEVRVEAHDE